MKNKSYNISLSKSKDLKSSTLLMEGDLCIKNALAIRKSFQSFKFNGETVTIQLKNVEKLDITLIQQIRSLRISLKNSGMETFIKAELNQDTERLLRNTGFDNTL